MSKYLWWACALILLVPLAWAGHSFPQESVNVALASSGCHAPAASFGGGNGTSTPFVIQTAAHLELLRDDSRYWDDSFVLTADIPLSDCTWASTIGDDTIAFTGHFDGGNKYIRGIDVQITGNYTGNNDGGVAGVFGVMASGASLRDLKVSGTVSADISGTFVFAFAGGLVGRAEGVTISTSSFTGTVSARSVTDHPYAGGILGHGTDVILTSVSARADVSAIDTGRAAAGGIVGSLNASSLGRGVVRDSWAYGSVLADGSAQASSGGIVGWSGRIVVERSFAEVAARGTVTSETAVGGVVGGGSANLLDTYARGSVTSTRMAGGLVGWSIQDDTTTYSLANSYFVGSLSNGGDKSLGGVVGRGDYRSPGPFQAPATFWDSQVSGVADAVGDSEFRNGGSTLDPDVFGAVGLSTASAQSWSTYDDSGWNISNGYDDDSVWSICPGANDGYPILSSFFSNDPCAGQVATLTPSTQSVPGTIGLSFSTTPLDVTGVTDPFFSITPALPAGSSLNPLTGVISGTRTYSANTTTYTVTAISPVPLQRGTAIVVMESTPPPTVSPTNQSISGVIGDAVLTAPLVVAGLPSPTFSVSPPLPAGLSLNSSTGVISGTLASRVFAPTTYTITASSGASPQPTPQTVSSTVTQTASPTPPMDPGQVSQFPGTVEEDGRFQAVASRPTDGYSMVVTYGTTQPNSYADDTIVAFLLDSNGDVVRGPISFVQAGQDPESYAQPSVAFNPVTGGWLACYSVYDGSQEVWCRYLDADGDSAGNAFPVSGPIGGCCTQSAIAFSPVSEDFFVVSSAYGSGLIGRLVDGAETGPLSDDTVPFMNYTDFTVQEGGLDAAADDRGTFGVVSRGSVQGGEAPAPWFFHVGDDGVPTRDPVRLVDDTLVEVINGSVAFSGELQQYMVVSYIRSGTRPLVARAFSAQDGSPVGPDVQTDFSSGQFTNSRNRPAIAAHAEADEFLVTALLRLSSDSATQLFYVMRLDGTGQASAPQWIAGDATNESGPRPRVAFNAKSCEFLTTYQQDSSVWGWQLFATRIPAQSPCRTPAPAPTPADPPAAPLGATATAGNAEAIVAWEAPGSSGSFPISSYQVTASPGGLSCLATARARTCTVEDLTNGTSYTFRVRALNGAGWSAYSQPSNAVTPSRTPDKAIVITGSRGADGADRRITVRGTTVEMVGAVVTPFFRFPGESSFREGSTTRTVDADGTFSWSRKTGRKIHIYFEGGGVRSNRIIIAAV